MQKLMQATFVFIFVLILSLVSTSFAYADDVLPRSGTEEDPYLISTADQLLYFAQLVNGDDDSGTADPQSSLCATLVADIDLNPGITFNEDGSYTGIADPLYWTPIGSTTNMFSGTFEGDDHAIRGLYSIVGDYSGLFGAIGSDGSVYDVVLSNGYVQGFDESGTFSYAGAVAAYNEGFVSNCTSSVSVLGGQAAAAGIVGYNGAGGTIEACTNTGTVNGSDITGGIAGYCAQNTVVSACVNTGLVTTQGSASSGGMIGYNLGALRMSCNSGALGNSEIGGLVGQCDPGSEISSSLYIGEATRYPIYVSSTDTTLWNVFYLNENHSAWFDPSGNEVDFAAVLIIPETDTWVKTIAFQINDELVYTVYVLAGTSAEEYVPTAENLASVLPEGYELTGWTAEEGSSNLFDFSTPVNGNIVLHAVLNDTRSDEPSDDEGQTTEDAALSDDGVDANPSSDSPASNGEPLPQTGDTPLLYVLSAMCLLSAIACAGSRLLSRKYSR